MPNKDNPSENTAWKQAVKLCKGLVDLDTDLAIEKINSLSLSDSVRSKAIDLLTRYENDNTILDNDDYLALVDVGNDSENIISKVIGSYKIISLIAKGGMSSVYKAEHIQAGVQKAVALKILSPYVFSKKSVELFNREQLILSKLEHPNIIAFHHSGKTEDGTRYLIMEYFGQIQLLFVSSLILTFFHEGLHENSFQKNFSAVDYFFLGQALDSAQNITHYCKKNDFTTKDITKYMAMHLNPVYIFINEKYPYETIS